MALHSWAASRKLFFFSSTTVAKGNVLIYSRSVFACGLSSSIMIVVILPRINPHKDTENYNSTPVQKVKFLFLCVITIWTHLSFKSKRKNTVIVRLTVLLPDLPFGLAEREGFEPPEPLSSTVFKTAAIDHSAISPCILLKCECKGKIISRSKKYSPHFISLFPKPIIHRIFVKNKRL